MYCKKGYAKRRKTLPVLPWLPIVTEETDRSSIYVLNAYANVPYPLLLMKKSWTNSVPYRDSFEYTKPTEGIGGSYSEFAPRINIHDLPPKKKKKFECPIPLTGDLGYPTKEWYEMLEKINANQKVIKEKEKLPHVVSLKELCSEDFYRKKETLLKKRKKAKASEETLSQYLAKVELAIDEERMYGLMYF